MNVRNLYSSFNTFTAICESLLRRLERIFVDCEAKFRQVARNFAREFRKAKRNFAVADKPRKIFEIRRNYFCTVLYNFLLRNLESTNKTERRKHDQRK